MKTNKQTIEVKLPTVEAIAAGLRVDDDAEVQIARERTATVRAEHAKAQRRLTDASSAVDRVRANVASGRAATGELERAIAEQKSAALVLPNYAQRIAEAEQHEQRALEAAKVRVREEGTRRIEVLQKAATTVGPLLEQLRDLELALDRVCPNLPSLDWPASLQTDAALGSWRAAPNPPARQQS
jgi:hypothetical protein